MKSVLPSFYIVIVLLHFSCKRQQKTVTNEMRNEVVNSIVHRTRSNNAEVLKFIADKDTADVKFKSEDSASLIQYITKIDSIFTPEDAAFMWRQALEYHKFSFDQTQFSDRTIIYPNKYKDFHGELFWDKIESEYHTDRYISFSMPLFSKDLSTVLITICDYADFRKYHGKAYAVLVYKKKNAKWEYFEQLEFAD